MKNGHLTDSDIINFLSGITEKETEQEMLHHLSSCETCRRDFEDFSKSLSQDNTSEVPGAHIKNAVLANAQERIIPARKTHYFLFPIIPAAAVLVFSLAGYLFYISHFSANQNPFEATLTTLSGIVSLNGQKLNTDEIISETSSIETASNSSAQIKHRNGLQLTIGSSSQVKLSSADAEKKTAINLVYGSIIAKSSHLTGYYIISGDYIFTPSGTEFFVATSGKTVYAGVSQGSILIIKSLTDGKAILKTSFIWKSDTNETVSGLSDRLSLLEVSRIVSKKEIPSGTRSSLTDANPSKNKPDLLKEKIIRKEIKDTKDDAVQERRELKQEIKNQKKRREAVQMMELPGNDLVNN